MKTLQFENYTDPIVYEEGFFKSREEEISFMNELQKRVEMAIIEEEAVKKRAVSREKFSLNE